MNEQNKNRLIAVAFWGLVIGGVLFWYVRDRAKQSSATAAHTAARVQREKTIYSLAAEHNANQEWEKSLANKTNVFTIDVQDALLNKSTPLQFIGALVDIRRVNTNPTATFDVSASGFSLSLRLICTDDQRKILTDKHTGYAIIANIVKVVRQGELNIVDASKEEDGPFEDATFELNWDTDTYWADGTCLDLRKLDE